MSALIIWLRVLLAFAIAVEALGPSATQAADGPLIPYAQEKATSSARSHRAGLKLAFPDRLPARGVLVATGNILSPNANWTIVDFDARTVDRIVTRVSAGGRSTVEERTSQMLGAPALNRIIETANAVWTSADADVGAVPVVTDALCSVALLDGDEVRHEAGFACPRTALVQAIEDAGK